MTAEAPAKSRVLWEECSKIISGGRRRAGIPPLSDSELHDEVQTWAEILAPIPPDRLHHAFVIAARKRSLKGMIQPGEILQAYQNWREAHATVARNAISWSVEVPPACFYCEGSGYQALMKKNGYSASTACACSAAPAQFRSQVPLREPEYKRDIFGKWWQQ